MAIKFEYNKKGEITINPSEPRVDLFSATAKFEADKQYIQKHYKLPNSIRLIYWFILEWLKDSICTKTPLTSVLISFRSYNFQRSI